MVVLVVAWGCLGAVVVAPRLAGATTYFVRTDGSDSGDGLTPATAFASIRSAGRYLLNPGDRVVVAPGDYHEGNIEPRRGGTEGEPVAFVADTTGMQTGEPPGAVRILPHPDRVDETTGFIVFGKRHVRIEGFTIVGADETGIEVRPSAQTGGSSADIALVGNVASQCSCGFRVQASSPIVITNNEAADITGPGIEVREEFGAAADVTVSDNHLSRNGRGIVATGVQHARFERNVLENYAGSAIGFDGGDEIVVQGNTIRHCRTAVSLGYGPSNLTVTGNMIEDCTNGVGGGVAGPLTISRNSVHRVSRGTRLAGSGVSTPIVIEENEFQDGYNIEVSGSSVALENNMVSGYVRGIIASAGAHADIIGNQLENAERGLTISAPQVTVQNNQQRAAGQMQVHGDSVLIDGNTIAGATKPLRIYSGSYAEVSHNTVEGAGGALWSYPTAGFVSFTANTIRKGKGIVVAASGAADVVMTSNQVVESGNAGLSVTTTGSVMITENAVTQPRGDGINLHLNRGASTAQIKGNTVAGGASGIVVDGVHNATIQDNRIDRPSDAGCQVDNADRVEIETNHIMDTGTVAITVSGDGILPGDCDRNGSVTGDEIADGVHRLFTDDVAAECSALGPNRKGRVSVASLVDAIRGVGLQHEPPSGDVLIHDNTVARSGGAGIVAYAAGGLTIHSNMVAGSAHTGVSATGTPSAAITLEGNTVDDAGNDCVLVSGGVFLPYGSGTAIHLAGEKVANCAESGIRIRDVRDATIENVQVHGSGEVGVLATRVESWTSHDDSIEDSVGGIALVGGRAVSYRPSSLSAVLENEHVERSSGDGMFLARYDRIVAEGCEVSDSMFDSLAVRRSRSVQLSGNTLTNAGASALTVGDATEVGADALVIDANQLVGFQKAGIDAYPTGQTLVLRNDVYGAVSSSGTGVSVRYPVHVDDGSGNASRADIVDVAGNRVRGGLADGIYVENALSAFVWDNAVFSAAGSGVFVRGTAKSEVVNTLVYDNAQNGIRLDHPGNSRVFNNTIYRNGLWGLASDAAGHMLLFNNILDGNDSGSVAVGQGDGAAIDEGYNLTTGAYSGLTPAETDIVEPPPFVDPDGADDVLGGDGAADDNFHLAPAATGQVSPAIDAGSSTAVLLGISGSVIEGGQGDSGATDLGYHYDATPRVP